MTKKNIVLGICVLLVSISAMAQGRLIDAPPGVPLGNTGWYVYLESTNNGSVQMFDFGVDSENIWLELDKVFTGGFDSNGVGDSIIIRFSVADPSAVNFRPNIVIRDERVMNDTGVEWHDFHIALGKDLSASPLQNWGFDPDYIFTPSDDNPFEDIAFEDDSIWLGTPYGGYSATPMQLNMFSTDGMGLKDDGTYYIFGGSSAGHLRIVTTELEQGDYFILKEWPTVPEPATMSLLALGALGLIRRKRA